MLEYKANWNDKQFVKIDRFFPSSKTCSSCGWIKQDLTLSIREWTCESCSEVHHRDAKCIKEYIKTRNKHIVWLWDAVGLETKTG